MRGMLPEADDFRASLGLPPLGDKKGADVPVSTVMHDAQQRLYDEIQALHAAEEQSEARAGYDHRREEYDRRREEYDDSGDEITVETITRHRRSYRLPKDST